MSSRDSTSSNSRYLWRPETNTYASIKATADSTGIPMNTLLSNAWVHYVSSGALTSELNSSTVRATDQAIKKLAGED